MSPVKPESRAPRVEIDLAADRCASLAGWPLWSRVGGRAVLGGLWLAALVGLGTALHRPGRDALLAAAGAGFVWAGGVGSWYGARLAAEARERDDIARRYGCRPSRGAAAVQRRRVRVVAPPADLALRVAAALRELSPGTRVERIDRWRFLARSPRRRWLELGLEIEVCLDEQTDGSVVAAVEARPCGYRMPFAPDPSVHPDGGRSLANIEELQLALRRRVEGVPRVGCSRADDGG